MSRSKLSPPRIAIARAARWDRTVLMPPFFSEKAPSAVLWPVVRISYLRFQFAKPQFV